MPVSGPLALPPCIHLDSSTELVTTVSGDKTIMFLKLDSKLEEDKPARAPTPLLPAAMISLG